MPIVLIQIRHKETGEISNTPESEVARYEENGWERVEGAEPFVASPVTSRTASSPEAAQQAGAGKAETGKKES